MFTDEADRVGNVNDTNVITNIIQCREIGLLGFDNVTEMVALSDTLREITKLGSKIGQKMDFQNVESSFLSKNHPTINSSWFIQKVGRGSGENVTRSWVVIL